MSSLPIIPSTIDVVSAQELQSTKRSSAAPDEATARTPGWQVAVLAVIAGYIGSYVFLNYKVYGSFMSGNTAQTGVQTGQGKIAEARLDLLPIPLFVAGVFVGTSPPQKAISDCGADFVVELRALAAFSQEPHRFPRRRLADHA